MGWEKNECWRLTLTKQRGDFGTGFVPDKGGVVKHLKLSALSGVRWYKKSILDMAGNSVQPHVFTVINVIN